MTRERMFGPDHPFIFRLRHLAPIHPERTRGHLVPGLLVTGALMDVAVLGNTLVKVNGLLQNNLVFLNLMLLS